MLTRIANRFRMLGQMLAFRNQLHNWREAWRAVRTNTRGVTLRLKNGMVIAGSARDDVASIFLEIFVEHCYTPAWFFRAEPGHTVLDVGANVGIFALYLSAIARGIRVFAFEPHPETFVVLTRNLAQNGLAETVSARGLAIGSGPGRLWFSGEGGLGSGHEAATTSGHGEAVEGIGLAEAIELTGNRSIDLLKVDTEGAEGEIIVSAPVAVWSRVARVVVEYHDLEKRAQVLRSLEAAGYACLVKPTRGYEHHLGLIYARRP